MWSGSAIVDHAGQLTCLFTYWNPHDGQRQSQGLATSTNGLTFTKHAANPVIPQLRYLEGHDDIKDFRDPKVFWHGPTQRWVMIVAGGTVRFFTSVDLVNWKFASILDSHTTECPDLFPLTCDGREYWVLSGGGRWYQFGQFDGHTFVPIGTRYLFGYGPDFYATQTFAHAPHGRTIALSWLYGWGYESGPHEARIRNPFPTSWAGGCLTVPTELTLRATSQGHAPRLHAYPVRELVQLRSEKTTADAAGRAWDAEIALHGEADATWTLTLAEGGMRPVTLTVDWSQCTLTLKRQETPTMTVTSYATEGTAPLPIAADGRVTLRILRDHCSLEIFAQEGAVAMSAFLLCDPALDQLAISSHNTRTEHLDIWKMRRAIRLRPQP